MLFILGDIYNLDINEYRLFLAKPNKTIVTEIGDYTNFKIKKQILGLDVVEFSIPFSVTNNKGETYKNPVYDLLLGDYLILVEYDQLQQWFLIENPSVEYSSKGDTKSVYCRSLEYIMSKKKVSDFESDTALLYSMPPDETGILNQLLPLQKNWTIGSVDTDLTTIYRSFKTSQDTLYECFNKLSRIFEVVFVFDTVNETIDIIRIENLPQDNRGLVLSDENLIEKYKEIVNTETIITKLYCYGDGNLSINAINATGQSYIENLSYYKNTNFMTQSLIDAQNSYEALVASKGTEFQDALDDLAIQYAFLYGDGSQSTISEVIPEYTYTRDAVLYTIPSRTIEYVTYNTGLVGELNTLQLELESEEIQRDIAIQLQEYGYTYDPNIINNLEAQIATKQGEIDVVNAEIDSINADIEQIGTDLDLENNFTQAQLEERDLFIREGVFKNNDIIDEEDLLTEGANNLAILSQPAIEFKMSVLDFLSIVEYQNQWDKLILGDIVNIIHEKSGSIFQVRLIGYTHVDNGNLTLEFSNRNNLYDSKLYLQDLFKQASSTTSSVDYKDTYWTQGGDTKLQFDTFLGNDFDASVQGIVTGDNQHVAINNRGIQLESGGDDPAQLRICNNVIAFSTDAFQTTDLAITPQGIYAPSLYAEIIVSENLTIRTEDNSTTIDENGITVTRSDEKFRTILNATDGILMEKTTVAGDWSSPTKVFEVDTEGNLIARNISTYDLTVESGIIKDGSGNTLLDATTGTLSNANIIGGVIKTSATGARVELNDSTNSFVIYNSNGGRRIAINYNNDEQIRFYDDLAIQAGAIFYKSSTDAMAFESNTVGGIELNASVKMSGVSYMQTRRLVTTSNINQDIRFQVVGGRLEYYNGSSWTVLANLADIP